MLEVRTLRAPKDIIDREGKAAERAELFLKSRLRRLSSEQTKRIEKKLDTWYSAWKKQTETQRRRLVRYAELLEGVVEDSNVPFEGASNVTLHYAAGMARSFRATFNKTAYQDEDIHYAMFSPELQKKLATQPEIIQALNEGFNESFSRESNGLRTLKEGTIAAVRDGTMVVSGYWRREVRHGFDQRTYRSIEEFQKDYPDAKAAGSSDEEYQSILDLFLVADEEDSKELVVEFEYEYVYKDEPEYKVGPWAKFVRYPTFSRDISDCQLYGYEVKESRDELKRKRSSGEYYQDGSTRALAGLAQEQGDAWDRSLGFVEGISPPTDRKDKPVQYIDGVCLLDLDNDGVSEKYLVRYAFEDKALLSLVPHRLRRGIDASVIFRMVRRENRLDGVSLIGDCEDIFNQIDTNVRHRNNVRTLTTSPIFIANSKYKEQIDLGRAENVIRPGVTYWVDDPKPDSSIRQLEVQDLSTSGDNMDELMLYKQHVELVFGPTQGLSGQTAAGDKRAPGNKTIALLNQANGRIDDYLDEFFLSLPVLADLHCALLYQYSSGPNLSFLRGGKMLSFPVQILADPGLRWGAKRRSVQLTPEFALARLGMLQQLFTQMLPLLSSGNPIAIEIWNRQVLASGEPNADKFLLSGENLQLIQQSMQAMQQNNPANPQIKAKAAGQASFHKELGKHAAQVLAGKVTTNGSSSSGTVAGR